MQYFMVQVTDRKKMSSYVEYYEYMKFHDGVWSVLICSGVGYHKVFS